MLNCQHTILFRLIKLCWWFVSYSLIIYWIMLTKCINCVNHLKSLFKIYVQGVSSVVWVSLCILETKMLMLWFFLNLILTYSFYSLEVWYSSILVLLTGNMKDAKVALSSMSIWYNSLSHSYIYHILLHNFISRNIILAS